MGELRSWIPGRIRDDRMRPLPLDRFGFPAVALVLAVGVGLAAGIAPWWGVLAALVLVGFGFAVFRNPVIGLMLLLATLAVGQLVRLGLSGGTGNLLATDVLLPLVLGAWLLVHLLHGTIPDVRSRLWLPALAWGIAMALSLAAGLPRLNLDGADARIAVLYAVRWVLYFGAYLMALDVVRSERTGRVVIGALIAVGLLVAGLGFVQLAVLPDFSRFVPAGWDPHVGRLLSTWFDPNFVGGFLTFVLLVALGVAFEVRGWVRVALIGAALALLAAVLLTYSRSAYAGLLVGGAVFALLRARLLLVVGALCAVLVFALVPRVQERVIGIRSVDETAQLRVVSWSNAIEVVKDHPLTGVGYNAYKFAQVKYGFLTDPAEHSAGGSDSSVLTVAVTTGAVGVVAFGWLWWEQFATAGVRTRSRGFRRGLSYGAFAGLVSLAVHGQFINGLLFPHLMLAIWVVLGVLAGLERLETSKP